MRCRRTGWRMRRARSACAVEILTGRGRRSGAARRCALAYEVPPRILITGSLYLAGHVLAANGTPPRIGDAADRLRAVKHPGHVELDSPDGTNL
jgi:hypothetical protein